MLASLKLKRVYPLALFTPLYIETIYDLSHLYVRITLLIFSYKMRDLVAIGNPTPSLAVPLPPGSVSNSSHLYDIAKQMGIAIVSTVTAGIASFLLNKLWKCIKASRNTSDDAAPPLGGTPEFITPPSSPSDLLTV